MTKQEFLAMSLPYGVKILTHEEVTEITAIGTGQYLISEKNIAYGWYGDICNCEPVLHPLSDLTKEIEHKGEKFIPIIELMEIAFGVEIDLSRVELSFKDDMYIAKINELEFGFDITDNSLLSFLHNLPSCVPKQLELFQKLIEWHFDISDLISKGEAIDVNTLEINPYK